MHSNQSCEERESIIWDQTSASEYLSKPNKNTINAYHHNPQSADRIFAAIAFSANPLTDPRKINLIARGESHALQSTQLRWSNMICTCPSFWPSISGFLIPLFRFFSLQPQRDRHQRNRQTKHHQPNESITAHAYELIFFYFKEMMKRTQMGKNVCLVARSRARRTIAFI